MDINSLVRQYNSHVSQKLADREDYFAKMEEFSNNMDELFDEAIEEAGREFLDIKIAGLEGCSTAEYFANVKDYEVIEEIYKAFARDSDYNIPEFVLEKIKFMGDEGLEFLKDLIMKPRLSGEEFEKMSMTSDVFFYANAAFLTLEVLKEFKYTEEFVDKYLRESEPSEFFSMSLTEYLKSASETERNMVISLILRELGKCNSQNVRPVLAHDYLLVALSEIAGRMENKEKEVFDCVRDFFKLTKDKRNAVICIGAIGDPRGIRVIKNFLLSQPHLVTRDVFYESLSALKRLGADISDLKDMFRDFEQR